MDDTRDAMSSAKACQSSPSSCACEDPCTAFGRVVGHSLKDMTDTQRKLAQKFINDVLYLGSIDVLSLEHRMCLSGSHTGPP